MASWTSERAKLAIHKRNHPDADDSELRRNLRAARAEDYLRRVVSAAPPFTAEQKARLRSLIDAAT